MTINLKCNNCHAEFQIKFINKNGDSSYHAVCPCCGHCGHNALTEISIDIDK